MDMDQKTFELLRDSAFADIKATLPEVTRDTSQAAALKARCSPTAPAVFLAGALFQFTNDADCVSAALVVTTPKETLHRLAIEACEGVRQHIPATPARSSSVASTDRLPPGAPGAVAHGALHMVPAPQVFDNGGSSSSVLTYPDDTPGLEGPPPTSQSPGEAGTSWSTAVPAVGTQLYDNLVPSAHTRKVFAAEVPLTAHSQRIMQVTVASLNNEGFAYKTLADVKKGDAAKLLERLPTPWVEDRAYSTAGLNKVHPANPIGVSADYVVPKEAATKSAALAALQKVLRQEQVRLFLPSAEAAKQVMSTTFPMDSPEALMATIFHHFAPSEDGDMKEFEDFDALPEAQQLTQVVWAAFAHVHEQARIASDRATLVASYAQLKDYDIHIQRVAAVAPQDSHLVEEAFGRTTTQTFTPDLGGVDAAKFKFTAKKSTDTSMSKLSERVDRVQKQLSAKQRSFGSGGFGKNPSGEPGSAKAPKSGAGETQHSTPGGKRKSKEEAAGSGSGFKGKSDKKVQTPKKAKPSTHTSPANDE
jgi:hypothetical protein